MPNRRDFFKSVAGAAAGACVIGRGGAPGQAQTPARRQVSIGGKRIRVIDVHAHTNIPIMNVVKGTPFEKQGGGNPGLEQRLVAMDKQGVDLQALDGLHKLGRRNIANPGLVERFRYDVQDVERGIESRG